MKVVIGGGRHPKYQDVVSKALNAIHARTPITRICHGACDGTDLLVAQWALLQGIDCRAYPADWDKWGRSAGPRRNSEMLTEEKPDAVIAFPGGSGTRDLVRRARSTKPNPTPIIEVGRL